MSCGDLISYWLWNMITLEKNSKQSNLNLVKIKFEWVNWNSLNVMNDKTSNKIDSM